MTDDGLRPDQVKFLSFEGGGRGGLVVHPGMLMALENDGIGVLRYDAAGRQVGVDGFAGSSSGSLVATFASCGYISAEVMVLLSEAAFDLVFRLEPIRLGQSSKLNGVCADRSTQTPVAAGMTIGSLLDDPAGAAMDATMAVHSRIVEALADGRTVREVLTAALTGRAARIVAATSAPPLVGARTVARAKWLGELAGDVAGLLGRRSAAVVATWGKRRLLEWLANEYPHIVFKLADHLLDPANSPLRTPDNLLNVFKRDFGIFGGCVWRDYIDNVLRFALFRVRYGADLPTLRLPTEAEMAAATAIEDLFLDRVRAAAADSQAASIGPDQSDPNAPDYEAEYRAVRNVTFETHQRELYPRLPNGSPVLVITGANLETRESHMFGAHTTGWLCVADAVRIATALTPPFKPVALKDADIPKKFPTLLDRFGAGHFLTGTWFDGGLYWNSPVDAFRDVESTSRATLAAGMHLGARQPVTTLSTFAHGIFNMAAGGVSVTGYEHNVSATRTDLGRAVEFDGFGIGMFDPRLSPEELAFFRADAWWRTFAYFGLAADPPP